MHQTLTLKVLATSLLAACLSLAACGDKTAENKTAQANEPTAKKLFFLVPPLVILVTWLNFLLSLF
ncbi:hypothetical protein DKL61_15470 [Gammaproteobacteria bacterium ESL0073]|nr:hypothetical protein DKL61_15470 [Gammaproteobacteria bacterium ESL0073]